MWAGLLVSNFSLTCGRVMLSTFSQACQHLGTMIVGKCEKNLGHLVFLVALMMTQIKVPGVTQ